MDPNHGGTPIQSCPAIRRRGASFGLLLLTALAVVLVSLAPLANGQDPSGSAQQDGEPIRASGVLPTDGATLFASLCARCHGLSGDGQGAEVLERPARDFTAGGFSFGNTEEALARTIRHGIPGSPMPSFGEALPPESIAALAAHVRTLTPLAEEATDLETRLMVREHPVVVRGGLPPIAADAPAHPRGLLLGLPGGLSFEYRVNDLALLGVRVGEFARRTDWTGRGGSSLEPLGQLMWLNERGEPGPAMTAESGARASIPLTAQLRSTHTPKTGARIHWDALKADGSVAGSVEEQVFALSTPLGSGFGRRLTVSTRTNGAMVLHHGVSAGEQQATAPLGSRLVLREDGSYEFTAALIENGRAVFVGEREGIALMVPDATDALDVTFVTLFMSEWTPPETGSLHELLSEAVMEATAPRDTVAAATPDGSVQQAAHNTGSQARKALDDSLAADTDITRAEAEHWRVEGLLPPAGAVLEVGGMDWMPDGRLAVSTRRGQIWMVENALAEDPADAHFSLYAEGLQEGLGLNVLEVPDGMGGTRHALYVLQRGELSELRDEDGDGRAESWLRVADGWGLSGNYHEFAFGLPDDGQGHVFISLNVGFLDPEWWLGQSAVPWRGWVLRIDPVTGETIPWASGFRSPCGLGIDSEGRLLLTDNQGDWMASTPVYSVQRDGFHGHPASLNWTPDYREHGLRASLEEPPEATRTPPALWVPYEWSRSAGNLVPLPAAGAFGPFTDQLVMAELTNGHLMRVQLEEVGGVTQGAVIPLRQRLGSVVRTLFAPDGSTLIAGLTNRGWGGLAPDNGLLRVRSTGVPPMEMDRVHLVPGGFEITFTEPVALSVAVDAPETLATIQQYDYDYWWEYGSPERHQTDVLVSTARFSEDRRTLSIEVPELRAAMVARIALHGIVGDSGRPLLHDEVAYTVNQLADGSHTEDQVSKAVPPPPRKQSGKEGWLRLSYGDALDAWDSSGWSLVDAVLDPDDRSRLLVTPGVNALVNVERGPASHFTSRWDFGSGTYHVEFMLPEKSHTTVWVQGRYGIALSDDTHGLEQGASPTGSLLPSLDQQTPARPPLSDTYTGAGHWHVLEIDFEAPQFEATGPDGSTTKTSNARFRQVRIDGTVIHEDVEFEMPSLIGLTGEVPFGPLVINGQPGPVSLRTLEFRPEHPRPDFSTWPNLLSSGDLSGWTLTPGDTPPDHEDQEDWVVEEGELIGEGVAGWILSPRGDYRDLSVHAQVRINDGGDAGLLLRASADENGRVSGYEAQINTSFSDPSRTGGVHGLDLVKVQLVPAGTWFDLDVSVRDEADGTRVRVAVNGVETANLLDRERRYSTGSIAVQQHHEGGVVQLRELRVDAH